MNRFSLSQGLYVGIIVITIVSLFESCSNNDNPTGPVIANNSLSFNSNQGNFSVSGPLDTAATSGSGVGAYRSDSTRVFIIAYKFNTSTDADVVVMQIKASKVQAGTYQFTLDTSATFFVYVVHANPSSPQTISGYVLTSGNVAISSITSGNIVGTFSGSGVFSSNVSKTISLTNGSFNASFVAGVPPIGLTTMTNNIQ